MAESYFKNGLNTYSACTIYKILLKLNYYRRTKRPCVFVKKAINNG